MSTSRVTESELEAVCGRINKALNRPLQPWIWDETPVRKIKAQIGNFHLSGAYGGYALHEMQTEGGGVRDVFGVGHVSKRELAGRMRGMLEGISAAREKT